MNDDVRPEGFEPDVFGAAKAVKEDRAEFNPSRFDAAFLETVCPECGRTGCAFVIDGPDPVFVDVECPYDNCRHRWAERIR